VHRFLISRLTALPVSELSSRRGIGPPSISPVMVYVVS